MPARSPLRRAASLGMAGLAALAASCTDDSSTTPTSPPPTVTTTTEPPRPDDGVLRIGLLLPESGAGATIGQPLIDAAVAAGDAINAAGGVLGRPIELIQGSDEGSNAATARDAIAALVEQGVDAVVGPASSTIALATLDDLLTAGVLTCSPTATALPLADFPDSDLFFRTAPSDSLQAVAIAELAERTGARSAAVVYLDDPYGRPLAEATIAAMQPRGVAVEAQVPFAADDESLVDEANAVSGSDVGVVVVIGDGEQGTRMLSQLGEATGLSPVEEGPDIIVNEAIRRPPSPQLVQALATDVRHRIRGVSPLAYGSEANEPAGPFATNAVDCVNLIALSAVQAISDNPRDMAAQLPEVSDRGVSCGSFAECIDVLNDNRNVDYDGPGRVLQIGADGDPERARFDQFVFDERGVDISTGTLTIS